MIEHEALSAEERNWGMACHLSAFSAYITGFGGVIGPLVVWLIKKDQFPSVDAHGKEALNFNISMTIYFLVTIPFVFLLIGIPMMIGLGIFHLITTIIASTKASNGEPYRYPLTIRLVQ